MKKRDKRSHKKSPKVTNLRKETKTVAKRRKMVEETLKNHHKKLKK